MPLVAAEATQSARDRLRAQPWGLAISVIAGDDVDILLDHGDDKFDEDSFFQIGSITKTMTGLLVADAVARGETSLDATVGSVLGKQAGNCADVSVVDLATQCSGLPRLPPNLDLDHVDPENPYASYTEANLLEALRVVDGPKAGYEYSNFGFMLLGLLLARITGIEYATLIRDRIFKPLGMSKALCGLPDESQRVPGYAGSSQTPWWTTQLPGAGGVACGIKDLTNFIRAQLEPPESLQAGIEIALAAHAPGPPVMGLGWVHQGGGHWHNGGTGGFRSFVAVHRGSHSGIALLANSHDAELLDGVGFKVLTEVVRSRLAR